MPSPTPYNRTFSFTDFQGSNPSSPLPGSQVDNELENVEQSLNGAINAIKDIRRSDGALKNESVTIDSLHPTVRAGVGQGSLEARDAAQAAQAAAENARAAAAASASAAATSAVHANDALEDVQLAQEQVDAARTGAQTARDFAAAWSSAAPNVEVDDGVNPPNKSAYHWAMVAEGAATGALPDGAVTTPKIEDEAVTRAKLAAAVTDELDGKADSSTTTEALTKRVRFDAAQTLNPAQRGQAVANIGGSVLSGFRNKILNGDFSIWQRGTGPFTAAGYAADRWLLSNGAGATNSIARSAAASAYPGLARFVMSWARSVAGSAASQIIQKMEDVRSLSGGKITLTFWAAANAPTEIQAYFAQVFGTGGSPDATVNVAAQTFSLDGAPKKFTATFDIPSVSGKAIGTNGDDCLWLLFRRLITASNPTALVNITLVSVVEGDATAENDPFAARHPQQELALCQRFYERADESDVGDTPVTGGNITSGQNYYTMAKFSVPKRAVPTVTRSTLNAGTGFSSVTVNGISKGGFTIQATANATSNNVIVSDWAADAEL